METTELTDEQRADMELFERRRIQAGAFETAIKQCDQLIVIDNAIRRATRMLDNVELDAVPFEWETPEMQIPVAMRGEHRLDFAHDTLTAARYELVKTIAINFRTAGVDPVSRDPDAPGAVEWVLPEWIQRVTGKPDAPGD